MDPRVAVTVRHVDLALWRKRGVRAAMKWLATHEGRRTTRHPELQQDFAVERDLAREMPAIVGEEHRVVGGHMDAMRSRVSALAPGAQEIALAVEDHHRMHAAIKDIDVIVAVDPDPTNLLE